MQYDFDHFPDRRSTESVKWLAYGPDVLPMWVADMDFLSPEPVIQALQQRAAHGVYGYPMEMPELRTLVVERLEKLYRWQVKPEEIVFVPGVVTAFNMACHALGYPGEGVLVQTPVYPPILGAPANAGLTRQELELQHAAQGYYTIDLEAFEAAITEKTKIFILCNPHNPVGRVFEQWELERMAEICLRRGVLICSDEIHGDLIFPGHRHIPIAAINPEIAQHTITLMAPSKTFNIAGLEFSVAVIPDVELRKKYQQGRKGLVGFVNFFGMTAALAAYRDGQDWLDQLLVYLEGNRDYLYATIRKEFPGVVMGKPEGTYLAWLDFRNTSISGNPYEFFLKQAKVALNDGVPFGKGGEGFVRLNFGCPRSMLEEALERMRAALKD